MALCWAPSTAINAWRYTGFKIGVVYNCDSGAGCTSTELGNRRAQWERLMPLNPLQLEAMVNRPVCCKGSKTGSLKAGQCTQPNVQGCCGGTAYELAHEKCCNSALELVVPMDQRCPCNTTDTDCPTNEKCCMPTKYTELATSNPNLARGQCYDPDTERCCDTGSVFDPGMQQCCSINGVQTLNVPCPCSTDAHCATTFTSTSHKCCKQSAPAIAADSCDKYLNYPSGQGAYQIQRCNGFCFDAKYARCCNGVTCVKEYERCCNSTCCNKFSGTCIEGVRPVAMGSPSNYLELNNGPLIYQACSTIEALTPVKAFWVFVFPAMLLVATLATLSLAIVFASKATPRSFSKLEYCMILVAIVTIALALPLFFAPVYKYGIWLVMVQMLVILTAAARIKWLAIVCVLVQVITLFYVFDPFHGNAFLNLASNRHLMGAPDTDLETSGLLHAVAKSWRTPMTVSQQNYCTNFYDWFKYDTMLRDLDRWDNPEITTFGYCSRGWVTALLFFAGFAIICVMLQLVLDLLGLFFRFHHDKVELEVHEEYVY
eukprot:NODE_147_length_2365_cov_63.015544_g128_i0.p1 GENE.NODE_147_length_2365_cov_63.015544_g128_i0~~NODE_147_length_2365_cov_63.015544_g128_i0.p1  ORF type:complete len:543 (+),score=141.36 NODE_147_length_2365_cov_63.015544_g128_i0:536-2164(+)